MPKPQARSLPAHLAAVVTLCGGLDESAAHAMIAEESAALHQAIPSGSTSAAYSALHQALPGNGGAIAPLLPDILGEALILQAFKALPDKGTATLTRASHRARRAVFDTVIRCGRDFIIRGHGLPLDWLKQLHAESEGDLWALVDLVEALPHETVELRKIASEITQSLVVKARVVNAPALLALALNNLSNRLADLGQSLKALVAAEESVRVCDQLDAENSEAHRPIRAMALNTLSNCRAELGDRKGALVAVEESIKIYRTLLVQNAVAFWPDLAGTLNTLSLRHAGLHQQPEALDAAEESVRIYNMLDAENSEALRPNLTGVLNNLSGYLVACGKRTEALSAAERGCDLCKALYAQNPAAFRPLLAAALNTLSNRQAECGKPHHALNNIQESTSLYRTLFAQNREAFRADLARSLGALAQRLAATDRLSDARDAIETAITTLSPLFLVLPEAVASLTYNLAQTYLNITEHQDDPDHSLLAPIITRFQSLPSGDAPDDN